MITLMTTFALSFAASANPLHALRAMFRSDPLWAPIAPCQDDFSCVQVGKLKLMMDQVELKRDGYEIVGVARPGQVGLILVRTHPDRREQLTLIMKDGGQIYAFNPSVDSRERPAVAKTVVEGLHTPELKRLLEARTEDQVLLHAEVLADGVHPNDEILSADVNSLFRDGLVSQEIKSRLNVLTIQLQAKSNRNPELPEIMREQLKALSGRVMADLKACGFAQTCGPRAPRVDQSSDS